jgi:hypothetical protein
MCKSYEFVIGYSRKYNEKALVKSSKADLLICKVVRVNGLRGGYYWQSDRGNSEPIKITDFYFCFEFTPI